jgi:hypothetical protein
MTIDHNNPSEAELITLIEEMSAKANTPLIKTRRRLAGISRKKRRFLHKIMVKRKLIMIDEFSSLGFSKEVHDFFAGSYKRSSRHEAFNGVF